MTRSDAPSTSLGAYDGSFAAGLLEAVTQVMGGAPVLLVTCDVPPPSPLAGSTPAAGPFAAALLLEDRMEQPELEALRTGSPAGLMGDCRSAVYQCRVESEGRMAGRGAADTGVPGARGGMRARGAALGAILILGLASPATAAEPGWSVEDLMARLAAVKEGNATFVEQKTLSVLLSPLVSSGIMRYRAPDYLLKQVLEPNPETYELSAGRLFVEVPGRPREEIDLDRYRPLRVLTESLRATMAGDLPTLTGYFRMEISGTADGWTLRLTPRDDDVARFVTAIVMGGRDAHILAIDTLDRDGDRSVTTITPVAE